MPFVWKRKKNIVSKRSRMQYKICTCRQKYFNLINLYNNGFCYVLLNIIKGITY